MKEKNRPGCEPGLAEVDGGQPSNSIVHEAGKIFNRNPAGRRAIYVKVGGELCIVIPMGIVCDSCRKYLERKGKPLKIDAPDPREVEICCKWLRLFARPRKSTNRYCTSYGLKHRVEDWAGIYVSNGAFIEASIREGFRIIRHEPNALLAASFRKVEL